MKKITQFSLVTLALFVLLAITVGASFLPLGRWSIPVALAISAAKASLILTVFMELREARGMVRIYAFAGLFWLALLLALPLADLFTRG